MVRCGLSRIIHHPVTNGTWRLGARHQEDWYGECTTKDTKGTKGSKDYKEAPDLESFTSLVSFVYLVVNKPSLCLGALVVHE